MLEAYENDKDALRHCNKFREDMTRGRQVVVPENRLQCIAHKDVFLKRKHDNILNGNIVNSIPRIREARWTKVPLIGECLSTQKVPYLDYSIPHHSLFLGSFAVILLAILVIRFGYFRSLSNTSLPSKKHLAFCSAALFVAFTAVSSVYRFAPGHFTFETAYCLIFHSILVIINRLLEIMNFSPTTSVWIIECTMGLSFIFMVLSQFAIGISLVFCLELVVKGCLLLKKSLFSGFDINNPSNDEENDQTLSKASVELSDEALNLDADL